jgi:hypothetical protein
VPPGSLPDLLHTSKVLHRVFPVSSYPLENPPVERTSPPQVLAARRLGMLVSCGPFGRAPRAGHLGPCAAVAQGATTWAAPEYRAECCKPSLPSARARAHATWGTRSLDHPATYTSLRDHISARSHRSSRGNEIRYVEGRVARPPFDGFRYDEYPKTRK